MADIPVTAMLIEARPPQLAAAGRQGYDANHFRGPLAEHSADAVCSPFTASSATFALNPSLYDFRRDIINLLKLATNRHGSLAYVKSDRRPALSEGAAELGPSGGEGCCYVSPTPRVSGQEGLGEGVTLRLCQIG